VRHVRVLYVIPGMSGEGGAERSLAAMAPYLGKVIDLHVLTFTGRTQLRGDLESAGARLTDLATRDRVHLVRELLQVIGDEKPDLVHTTLIDADVVGRFASVLRRTPVVSSLVNVRYERAQRRNSGIPGWKTYGVWGADAATAQLAVRFHALTGYVADTMARRLLVGRGRIDVIPRGRDAQRLGRRTEERRAAARERLLLGAEPVVVAAARHERQKGLDVLLSAVPLLERELPDLRVFIGGREGLQTTRLRERCDELDLADRVAFIGQRDDVADLMCAADVWCVPSRWEGLGSILIEAMALEVPVVATSAPAIREVAGDPPCFRMVPPDDPCALAGALLEALRDPTRSQSMTLRGRERFIERYTADAVAEQMLEFYERSLSTSRLGRLRRA
jgi:glycosyltransferase involved in cell wall biosynthesis